MHLSVIAYVQYKIVTYNFKNICICYNQKLTFFGAIVRRSLKKKRKRINSKLAFNGCINLTQRVNKQMQRVFQ